MNAGVDFGGDRSVVVSGSLTCREHYTPKLDIDLAVWSIPATRFYAAVGAVTGVSKELEVD